MPLPLGYEGMEMPSGLEPEITRFERAVVRPATLASSRGRTLHPAWERHLSSALSLANVAGLEPARLRLRTELLEPLCIHVHLVRHQGV